MNGLKPIKMPSAKEKVAAELRKAILSRQMQEGEVLSLDSVATQLNVSAMPVREAFQILARDGLIQLCKNKGAVVLGITETYIKEHYQLRAILESSAAALAADPEAVANALARSYHWTIAPCGNTALNLLGLSTQVTAVWSYISDGPYKTYEWNSTKLEFKHRTNKEITGLSYMTSLVIQALKTLGKSNVTPEVIQMLSEKLTDKDKQACLKEATESTDWVYDTIRQICGGEKVQ